MSCRGDPCDRPVGGLAKLIEGDHEDRPYGNDPVHEQEPKTTWQSRKNEQWYARHDTAAAEEIYNPQTLVLIQP